MTAGQRAAALKSPHRVAVAVTEGAPIFDVAIPCEVFGRRRPGMPDNWYEFRVCSVDPRHTRASDGFLADTEHGLSELRRAGTVIIPALADPLMPQPPQLLRAVRDAHESGARIASICSGAFVLAAAGLLDGRRAAVHWMLASMLSGRYPRVDVDPAVLYVDDGDILTSAGTAAGLDLCLHIVRVDFGADVANTLARRLVVPPHRPGGQAQYAEAPVPRHDDDGLAPLLHWAIEHLDQPLTIADLARYQRLAPRTLIRRFQLATGTSPLRWLLAQRVQHARWLLESTDDPLSAIARRCGLGTEANLRYHFTRLAGVAPAQYRRTFKNEPDRTGSESIPLKGATMTASSPGRGSWR